MGIPVDDLSTDALDANTDSLVDARVQLLAATNKLKTLLGESIALLDEAETFTAKKTFTLSQTPIELRGAGSDGCYIPFHADISSPSTRSGRIGYIGNDDELVIENEETNDDIDIRTNGTGEVLANGNRVLTVADSTDPSDGSVTRAKLDTLTGSQTGSVAVNSTVNVNLNAYSFMPSADPVASLAGGGDADSPRVQYEGNVGKGAVAYSYQVYWRYIAT